MCDAKPVTAQIVMSGSSAELRTDASHGAADRAAPELLAEGAGRGVFGKEAHGVYAQLDPSADASVARARRRRRVMALELYEAGLDGAPLHARFGDGRSLPAPDRPLARRADAGGGARARPRASARCSTSAAAPGATCSRCKRRGVRGARGRRLAVRGAPRAPPRRAGDGGLGLRGAARRGPLALRPAARRERRDRRRPRRAAAPGRGGAERRRPRARSRSAPPGARTHVELVQLECGGRLGDPFPWALRRRGRPRGGRGRAEGARGVAGRAGAGSPSCAASACGSKTCSVPSVRLATKTRPVGSWIAIEFGWRTVGNSTRCGARRRP